MTARRRAARWRNRDASERERQRDQNGRIVGSDASGDDGRQRGRRGVDGALRSVARSTRSCADRRRRCPAPSGTAIVPSGADLDRRIDQIGIEVALAGRDVAGQREVRQRRQMDVVRRGRCPISSMPPCQTGMPCARAEVVQPNRLGEAADAPRLDVDDAAGAGAQSPRSRRADGLDRLVEADRRRQLPLQRRVIARCRRSRAAARSSSDRMRSSARQCAASASVYAALASTISGIAPKRVAHRLDGGDVPARLDLDLDAPVAGRELALARARASSSSESWMPIETPDAMRSRVPPRTRAERLRPAGARSRSHAAISTAAFAMLWPRIAFSAGNTSRGCANVDAEHARRDEVRDDVPGRLVRLGAVVRILLGDALAVRRHAVALDAHEDEMFVVDAAEAGLEEVDERKLEQAQLQAFDLHGAMISSGRLAVPLHRDRRADRRGQNRAGRAARHAPRRHGRPRGNRESVPRRLLRRPARRRAAGAALLPARTATASRPRCGRPTSSARPRSATTCSTRTRSSRT